MGRGHGNEGKKTGLRRREQNKNPNIERVGVWVRAVTSSFMSLIRSSSNTPKEDEKSRESDKVLI